MVRHGLRVRRRAAVPRPVRALADRRTAPGRSRIDHAYRRIDSGRPDGHLAVVDTASPVFAIW